MKISLTLKYWAINPNTGAVSMGYMAIQEPTELDAIKTLAKYGSPMEHAYTLGPISPLISPFGLMNVTSFEIIVGVTDAD